MRFVCRTRVALLAAFFVRFALFSLSVSSFLSKRKKDKKTQIKWVLSVLTKNGKYRKRLLPSSSLGKTVTPDRHSFVWFGTCTQVLSFFTLLCSNALTKRRRRRGVSSRARSARARRRVDEEGVERVITITAV